jgi:hypothetical protein
MTYALIHSRCVRMKMNLLRADLRMFSYAGPWPLQRPSHPRNP